MQIDKTIRDNNEYTVAGRLLPIVCLVLLAWVMMRAVFFEGFVGSDDFPHLRFAWYWDRAPMTHWETRLPYNGLLRLSLVTFGFSEFSAALPGLFGSLMILSAVMCFAWRCWRDEWKMLIAGLLFACMPIDVMDGTLACASKTLASGFLAWAAVLLVFGRTRRSAVGAGLLGAMCVVTHMALVFAVMFVCAGTVLLDRSRWRMALGALVIAGFGTLAINAAIFGLWTGDPMHRFHVIANVHMANVGIEGDKDARHVFAPDGSLSAGFIARPIIDLLVSKPFGIMGLAALITTALVWKRLSSAGRVLCIITAALWFWMSYGSHSPTKYVPFPGTAAYWHPLAWLLALIVADAVTCFRRKAWTCAAVALVVLADVVMLAGSGSWGQSVEVSRELLAYARSHPESTFITDDRTMTEMAVLNAFDPLPNVCRAPQARKDLLVPLPRLHRDAMLFGHVFVLENPLNTCREPEFTAFLRHHGGSLEYAGQSEYRMMCRYIAPLRQSGFAVRKPPGRVLTCVQ